ncbi:lasso peptide biosynthesis B2 protein [Smaragdicoccus niigatensis]|uniref:lasso peptide biosynthesis B2 protein n=1 Tax=Smaragdicoccus niigatensis TaxID=359359 RepID=UPI000374F319|nr:lasso peptide biosynthesis B2 protein [Smaragdicoccus niigatensis]
MRRDPALVVQAAVILPAIAILLRVVGLRRTRKVLRLDGASESGDVPEAVRRSAAAVATVVRHSPSTVRCLPRSLAVAYLSRRRGHHLDIVIGIAPGTGDLAAHAWVEFAGIPVNDTADVRERYAVLAPVQQI